MGVKVFVVYCVTFIVLIHQASLVNGLICYCSKAFSGPGCEKENGTNNYVQRCDSGVCFINEDILPGSDTIVVMKLCVTNAVHIFQCDTNGGKTLDGKGLCCRDNYCNNRSNLNQLLASLSNANTSTVEPTLTSPTVIDMTTVGNVTVTAAVNVSATESSSSDSSPPAYAIALIVVLSFIILVVAVIIIVILSMYFFSWYRNSKPPIKDVGSVRTFEISTEDITASTTDWSAGSGSGLPVLFQAHIAQQITREHLIGRGRYGQVWRGYYKGELVAVKVFQSIEETSWNHEVDIYNKCGLRHPNILRFIAADRSDAGMFIENWLIAEYCENGNLYDYLQCYVLDEATVVAMAHDIASGIFFIHSVITGTEGKASVAHRDLKSRNILVKKDLSLVIGDFGLAVRHDINNDTVEEAPTQRVGTKRYLAPEILDGTMNMNIFDSFKRADIYSFGLVLWEIVRRGQCNGVVEEPQLPYFDCVPSDPSFEEMQNVVCVEQRRPLIPSRWHQSPVFSGLAKLMNECWHHNGEARLKALRVRRRLEDILHKNCDKGTGDSPKSTAKPS